MSGRRLKSSSQEVINPTNRIDIKASDVMFEIGEGEGGKFRYRLVIRTWASLVQKMSPRYNLTLQFERGGEPVRRIDLGNAEPIMRRGGVIVGEIDGGFDPSGLAAKIKISDPSRNHLIVAFASKGRPDVTDADIPDDDAEDNDAQKINPLRKVRGPGTSLITLFEGRVNGGWNLRLRNVDVPQLTIHSSIGKHALETDPRVQLLVLTEVFRRILTELALHPEEFEEEPWVRMWQKFGAAFTPIGDWSYFVDEGDLDRKTIEARVDDTVGVYQEKLLERVESSAVPTDDKEED